MNELVVLADHFVRLRDDRRSVEFVHYVWDADAHSHANEFFRRLLLDRWYRRYFLGPNDVTDDLVHGPYAIDRLTPADYHPTPPSDCLMRIRAFLSEGATSVDGRSLEMIRREVEAIPWESRTCFALEPATASRNDLEWMLGDGFKEVVAIDLEERIATLIITVDD